jgi:RNA polymerase sigma factor (sigma-70 family)
MSDYVVDPEDHLALIISVLKSLKVSSDQWEDLYQEGFLGLDHAAKNYDRKKGVQFSTYACKCIRGSVLRAIDTSMNFDMMPVPVHLREKKTKIKRLTRKARTRNLTRKEKKLISRYNTPNFRSYRIDNTRLSQLHNGKPTNNPVYREVSDRMVVEEDHLDRLWKEELLNIATDLSRTDPNIRAFMLHKIHGKTLNEVEGIMGLSYEAVRKKAIVGLQRLRAILKDRYEVG